jgi:Leu/Phe-tRNA-protein transferase
MTTASRTRIRAVVTRYPTGCFGLDYQGRLFFWWGFGEHNIHAEIHRLRIPPANVKWQERYYDRKYHFNDPRSYRTRKYTPKNPNIQTP